MKDQYSQLQINKTISKLKKHNYAHIEIEPFSALSSNKS